MSPVDVVVRGAVCLTPSGRERVDVAVRGGRIVELGDLGGLEAVEVLDLTGLHLLPGVIDTQVHFREPGHTHKEDIGTGSASAALGGVTGYFEMPNTTPNTDSAERLAWKVAKATETSWVDFAFYVGATRDNTGALAQLESLEGCAGVKMFLGSSTGTLLVDDSESIRAVLRSGRRRVACHSEDEARLRERKPLAGGHSVEFHPEWRDEETAVRSTRRLLALAEETGRPVHVLHVSTAGELPLLAEARSLATVEVTPQHLSLVAPDCYRQLGTRAQMNPPIREGRHREALWKALRQGLVDVLGSDHAPHTLAEKSKSYPDSPSGMPGVQTLVPVMLTHVSRGSLTLERLVDLTSAGPARVFGLLGKGRIAVGYDADFTVVDLARTAVITSDWSKSRCGWTPFEGFEATGWPVATVVRGHLVMRDGELLGSPQGRPIRFSRSIE